MTYASPFRARVHPPAGNQRARHEYIFTPRPHGCTMVAPLIPVQPTPRMDAAHGKATGAHDRCL